MTDAVENALGLIGTGIGIGALGIGAGILLKSMGNITEATTPKKKKIVKKKIMKRKVKFMGLN
jgi:hypothetical protein